MNNRWQALITSLLLHLLVLAGLSAFGRDLVIKHRVAIYEVALVTPSAASAHSPPVEKETPAPSSPPAQAEPSIQKNPLRQIAKPTPVEQPVGPETPRVSLSPFPEPALPEATVTVIEASTGDPPLVAAVVSPEVEYARQVKSYSDAQLSLIREKVNREVRYPIMARRQGWVGRVTIEFTVQLSGEVGSLRVAESSGYPILDRQALLAVQAASPFFPPPVVATLVLPVAFALH